jgi:sulfatase maturation enzyme AslB (radical SAM superfamily)
MHRVKSKSGQNPAKEVCSLKPNQPKPNLGGLIYMSAVGLQPQPEFDPDAEGVFLTFVVPALNGCNLDCSFCLVRQRKEITETRLTPENYAQFVREVADRERIFALAIQGYEPLLPEALPFTQAILAAGRFLGVPTSLVTNGVGLGDAVDLLKTLTPNKIAVSLDAASPEVHDGIRGVKGAWEASVAGLRRAIEVLAPQTLLVVNSVLLPSRRHYLDAMPARLREIGIGRWIVNPVLRVGREQAGGPVAERARLYRDLAILQEAADRAGVRLTVDDEFGHLDCGAASPFQLSSRGVHVRPLPPRVTLYRLTPGGQCSRGSDVLKQVTSTTPCWQPGATHAGDFIDMIRGKHM